MIVVDSSVLIALLRNDEAPEVDRLTNEIRPRDVLLGDIVLLEILQGARDDDHARKIERNLAAFRKEPLLDPRLGVAAAGHCRALRALGKTVSKTTDLIIATFCIEHGHELLHRDRDFEPFVEHLGLRLA